MTDGSVVGGQIFTTRENDTPTTEDASIFPFTILFASKVKSIKLRSNVRLQFSNNDETIKVNLPLATSLAFSYADTEGSSVTDINGSYDSNSDTWIATGYSGRRPLFVQTFYQ